MRLSRVLVFAIAAAFVLTPLTAPRSSGEPLSGNFTETAPDGAVYGYDTHDGADGPRSILRKYVPGGSGTVFVRSAMEGYYLRTIGAEAFRGCSGLEHVIIPDTVGSIEDRAFSDCGEIKLYFLGKRPAMGSDVFAGTDVKIYRSPSEPDGWDPSVDLMDSGLYSGEGFSFEFFRLGGEITVSAHRAGTQIAIPDTIEGMPVKRIGQAAFEEKTGDKSVEIKSVSIGENVTEICDRAFYDCNRLETVNIPSGTVYIDNEAFRQCYVLKDVSLPGSLKYLGFEAFRMCYGFENIVIPDSLVFLGGGAFYVCEGAKTLTIGSSVSVIRERAFGYCDGLKNVEIPDTVTRLDENAFYSCKALEKVTVGNGVESIGYMAFYENRSLTSVRFGDSLTHIHDSCFERCALLSELKLPDGIRHIGKKAFGQCTYLEHVYLGKSLKSMGAQAFTGCRTIRTVTIPETAESVGDKAFFNCSSLEKAVFEGPLPEMGSAVFDKTSPDFGIEYRRSNGDSWGDYDAYPASEAAEGGNGGPAIMIAAAVSVLAVSAAVIVLRLRK